MTMIFQIESPTSQPGIKIWIEKMEQPPKTATTEERSIFARFVLLVLKKACPLRHRQEQKKQLYIMMTIIVTRTTMTT